IDGLGVAMAPATLIADDVRAGRLVTPFPHIFLPSRSYFAYIPIGSPLRTASDRVCAWIEGEGGASATPVGEP
ncbi:MAG: transcriptional regulator, partial [Starkeya sp.]|nr:transcriptional regulator [Starkeya sp.]